MNFAQLRDAARERCGLTTTDQMATPANMGALVNAALHDVETRKPAGWPWAYTTVNANTILDQQSYPFSSLAAANTTWLKIRNVRMLVGVTWATLEPMSIAALRTNYRTTVPQMPWAWSTDGYQLLLGPIPNDAWPLSIDALLAEPDLVADADTPLMPATFHQAIVEQAAYLEYRRLNNVAGTNAAGAAVQQVLATMFSFSRTRTGPGRVTLRDPVE